MTLPVTGPISMRDVNIELEKSATQQISLGDAIVRELAEKMSGAISLGDLRGKSAVARTKITFNPRPFGLSFGYAEGNAGSISTNMLKFPDGVSRKIVDMSVSPGLGFQITMRGSTVNQGSASARVANYTYLIARVSGLPETIISVQNLCPPSWASFDEFMTYGYGSRTPVSDQTDVAKLEKLITDTAKSNGTIQIELDIIDFEPDDYYVQTIAGQITGTTYRAFGGGIGSPYTSSNSQWQGLIAGGSGNTVVMSTPSDRTPVPGISGMSSLALWIHEKFIANKIELRIVGNGATLTVNNSRGWTMRDVSTGNPSFEKSGTDVINFVNAVPDGSRATCTLVYK